jgi:transcriptional regulator with XRE-family HTH domain
MTGLSAQVISNTENGTTAIRPENLLKLSQALGVSVDYLLTGTTVDKDILVTYGKMQHLNSDQILDLQKIIDLFIKNAIS